MAIAASFDLDIALPTETIASQLIEGVAVAQLQAARADDQDQCRSRQTVQSPPLHRWPIATPGWPDATFG